MADPQTPPESHLHCDGCDRLLDSTGVYCPACVDYTAFVERTDLAAARRNIVELERALGYERDEYVQYRADHPHELREAAREALPLLETVLLGCPAEARSEATEHGADHDLVRRAIAKLHVVLGDEP